MTNSWPEARNRRTTTSSSIVQRDARDRAAIAIKKGKAAWSKLEDVLAERRLQKELEDFERTPDEDLWSSRPRRTGRVGIDRVRHWHSSGCHFTLCRRYLSSPTRKVPMSVVAPLATRSAFVVLKFGGTSVSSVPNWKNIAAVLRDRMAEGLTPVIVHSALSGITDRLEQPPLAMPVPDGSTANGK